MIIWTAAKNQCAGLALLGPPKTVLNRQVVVADGNINPEDGPGDDETLKLGGRSHGWDLFTKMPNAPPVMQPPWLSSEMGSAEVIERADGEALGIELPGRLVG